MLNPRFPLTAQLTGEKEEVKERRKKDQAGPRKSILNVVRMEV